MLPLIKYLHGSTAAFPSKVGKYRLARDSIVAATNCVADHLRLVVREDIGIWHLSPSHHKERFWISRARVARNMDGPGVFAVLDFALRKEIWSIIQFSLHVASADMAGSDLDDHCLR